MKEIIVYNSIGERLIRLAQWDSEVYLYITDAGITKNYPVHFFNKNSEQAYVVESTYSGGKLKAKIPNILLREPQTICGYIQSNEGAIEKRSDFRFIISVIPKPQPLDYVLSDQKDYLELADLIDDYKKLIAQAEDAIKNANEANKKATSVVEDAKTATKNADAATTAAQTATQDATKATEKADDATTEAKEAAEAARQAAKAAESVINQSADLAFVINDDDGGLDVSVFKEGY